MTKRQVRMLGLAWTLIILGLFVFDKFAAWPAENAPNEADEVLFKEVPVLERFNEPGKDWLVVKTAISPAPLRLKMTVYRFSEDPDKYRATLRWDGEYFANADNIGFDKKKKKHIWDGAVWNIKNENGSWTNFKEANGLRVYDNGIYNGRRVVIFRIVSNKDTLAYRTFELSGKNK
jgi:hypothetical protein